MIIGCSLMGKLSAVETMKSSRTDAGPQEDDTQRYLVNDDDTVTSVLGEPIGYPFRNRRNRRRSMARHQSRTEFKEYP
jgi:hypothetical protein